MDTVMNNVMNLEDMNNILGQTMLITKSNAESTAIVLQKLDEHSNLMKDFSNSLNNTNVKVTDLTDRMDILELQEEITTTQVQNLTTRSKRKIYEILGDDEYDHQRYYRTFISRLYTDCRKMAGLGSSIARTRKADYIRCMDFIESWTPRNGIRGLKKEIDEKAKLKKMAKKNGYK